jgi:hypothetical protein
MNIRQRNAEALRDRVLVLALVGSVLSFNGSAAQAEGPTEVEVDAVQETIDVDATQEAPDGAAAGQSPESRRQQRQAFREARRQARLDRIRPAAQKASNDKVIEAAASSSGAALTSIDVSFKLDSGNATGLPTGERWISPAFAGVQEGGQFMVEAKAEGRDGSGNAASISPAWVAADPNMVEVSPGAGAQVKITVRDSGQSRLIVAAPGFSKELSISAISAGRALHVQIFQ